MFIANAEDLEFFTAVRELGEYVEKTGAYNCIVTYPASMTKENKDKLMDLIAAYKKDMWANVKTIEVEGE